MRGRRWGASGGVLPVEHPHQVVDRGPAGDEVAGERDRTRAGRQVLVEEAASRSPGRVIGRQHDVLRSQPVAVVLGGPNILMDDVGRVTPTDQVVDILIEDHSERIGPEPTDVVAASEDRFEHGCPPGDEVESRGEHPDYAERCPQETRLREPEEAAVKRV